VLLHWYHNLSYCILFESGSDSNNSRPLLEPASPSTIEVELEIGGEYEGTDQIVLLEVVKALLEVVEALLEDVVVLLEVAAFAVALLVALVMRCRGNVLLYRISFINLYTRFLGSYHCKSRRMRYLAPNHVRTAQ